MTSSPFIYQPLVDTPDTIYIIIRLISTEVRHVILYFKLENRSNVVSTTKTVMQIFEEFLFHQIVRPTNTIAYRY